MYQLANLFLRSDQEPGDEEEQGEPERVVVEREDESADSAEKGQLETGSEKKDDEASIALSSDDAATETSSTRARKLGKGSRGQLT